MWCTWYSLHALHIPHQCSATQAVFFLHWNKEAEEEEWRDLLSPAAQGRRWDSADYTSAWHQPRAQLARVIYCSTTLMKPTSRSWSGCLGMQINEVLGLDLHESRQNFLSQAHWGLECSLLASETDILYILQLYRVQGGCFPHVQNYTQHMQAQSLLLCLIPGRPNTHSYWPPLTLVHVYLSWNL